MCCSLEISHSYFLLFALIAKESSFRGDTKFIMNVFKANVLLDQLTQLDLPDSGSLAN